MSKTGTLAEEEHRHCLLGEAQQALSRESTTIETKVHILCTQVYLMSLVFLHFEFPVTSARDALKEGSYSPGRNIHVKPG